MGAGIGGLTTAALLARSGRSVLVVERHDRPGGYAHGFRRKRYTFDSGVHLVSGCGPEGFVGGQIIHRILQAVGITDDVEFISVNPYARVSFPGVTFEMPQGAESFIKSLCQKFPPESNGIRDFFATCLQLAEQVSIANDVMETGNPQLIREKLAILLRYRNLTLKEGLDEYLADEQLKTYFGTLWPYLGLPPSRLSFLYWAIMFIGYTVDGAYCCKGTFQKYADALVKGITINGGEIVYRTSVNQINIEAGKVHGVTLENGKKITAPIVASNADAKQTVHSLVGAENFPASFLKRLAKFKTSLSAFVVYLATDLDVENLDICHEGFFYSGFDHEENFSKAMAGEVTWLSITVPTMLDPSLAPKGEHLILLTALMPFDAVSSWHEAKPRYQHAMVDLADHYLPGLKDHILFVESGSPTTMERYTLNTNGAAYGWELTPEQVGANRLTHHTPVNGLFLTGHWTMPGGGINGVSISGVQTAQAILEFSKLSDFWQSF